MFMVFRWLHLFVRLRVRVHVLLQTFMHEHDNNLLITCAWLRGG